MKKTLYDKLWDAHLVKEETPEHPAILYIDLHLIHEVTSPQAFQVLREAKLPLRCPQKTFATTDHSTPTLAKAYHAKDYVDEKAKFQVEMLEQNCKEFGIELFNLGHENQGIVHVIGPELGLTQPAKTIVCGDSHTSTHGAFGALAFGIGTSEVSHVFATQSLLQRKSKNFCIEIDGALTKGVSAKDLILYIISKIGINGATGHVIEFRGTCIDKMSMDERMTICNMAIEAGARSGLIAPDETTFKYLEGRAFAPKGDKWKLAKNNWEKLKSDEGANFDRYLKIEAVDVPVMISYGVNPEMAMPISDAIPQKADDAALTYMGFKKGETLHAKQKIDYVFIGSCTNSRLSDLRAAANIFRGKKVADGVRTIIVAGSVYTKKAAEEEGLDQIFLDAGAEWREPGCSMCIAMNGDMLQAGELAVSTSNRNFEGRQGKGGRTILASPETAAASAIYGTVHAAFTGENHAKN